MATTTKGKKSVFDAPLFRSRIKSDKVKIWPEAALGYLVGPTLAVLSNSFMSSYLNKYFSDVLRLNEIASLFNTLLPLLSVILVVLGNIFIGKLMDKNKSLAGKARPLLLCGAPLILAALLVLFGGTYLVKDNVVALCIIAAIGYNFFFAFGYPMYYTAHSTMVNLSTRDSSQRGLLGTISMATQLAAIGVCQMIFPFLIGTLHLINFTPEGGGVVTILGIGLGIAAMIGASLEFFFTRERITEENMAIATESVGEVETVTTSKQLKVCVKDKYWWIIIAFWFLYQLGGMLKNNSQLYFSQAIWGTVGGSDTSGLIAMVGAIPTAVGMVLAWPLSRKIGKGKAILLGSVVAFLGGLLGYLFPENQIIVVISFVIKAFGSTPAMYLGLALTADMLDHQEAKNGFRCDGLTMAIYGAIMVGMAGVANGVINGIMGVTEYKVADLVEQGSSANAAWNEAMKFVFLLGEAVCYAIIAVLYIFMNVEKHHKEDLEILEARKNAATAEEAPVAEEAEVAL